MALSDGFSFDGIHSDDFNIIVGRLEVPLLPDFDILTEKIPGRGLIFIAAEPGGRTFEADCVIEAESYEELVEIGNQLATWLNPQKGLRPLILDREPGVQYDAIYSGKLKLTELIKFGKFRIEMLVPDGFGYIAP